MNGAPTDRIAGFIQRFGWPEYLLAAAPLAIAHRGASDHAPENTLKAFRMAHDLGAEMWEIDVRVTSDGVPVVIHDADLSRLAGRPECVSQTALSDLRAIVLADDQRLPTLDEVIDLAEDNGRGLYIELKDEYAGPCVVSRLTERDFRFAVIGSFITSWIADLRAAGCPWPLAVLVPRGVDPLTWSAPARPDIVHLCWEAEGPRPDRLVTSQLTEAIHGAGAEIVAWHEERAEVLATLLEMPLLGICSNRPGMLKPWSRRWPELVCHRGANAFAPENTLAAARICFEQRFNYVELDLRQTTDGALVVMHDTDVKRTTNGQGLVCDMALNKLRELDAGAWFGDLYAGVKVPIFSEVLEMARTSGFGLYVEIKDADPILVLRQVEDYGLLNMCFFWSFNSTILDRLRAAAPAARIMAPRWMYGSVAEAAARHGAQIVEFDATRDDLSELAICRQLGLTSMIYSRSNDPEELARYAALNPDILNLDRPDLFRLMTLRPEDPRIQQVADKT